MSKSTAVTVYARPMHMPVQTADGMMTLLQSKRGELEVVLPIGSPVTVERIITAALEACEDNHDLYECTGESVFRSVRSACEMGLSLSKSIPQAHIVPFKSKKAGGRKVAQLIIDYRGLMDLVRRAAGVENMDSSVVYQGDLFEVVKGVDPSLVHRPDLSIRHDDRAITHVYSIAWYETGRPHFEVMNKAEVDAIRARSKGSDGVFWKFNYPAMARKTVIRRHAKYLPVSAEKTKILEKAFTLDNEAHGMVQPARVSQADRRAALRERLSAPQPSAESSGAVIDAEASVVEDIPDDGPKREEIRHLLSRAVGGNERRLVDGLRHFAGVEDVADIPAEKVDQVLGDIRGLYEQ